MTDSYCESAEICFSFYVLGPFLYISLFILHDDSIYLQEIAVDRLSFTYKLPKLTEIYLFFNDQLTFLNLVIL